MPEWPEQPAAQPSVQDKTHSTLKSSADLHSRASPLEHLTNALAPAPSSTWQLDLQAHTDQRTSGHGAWPAWLPSPAPSA